MDDANTQWQTWTINEWYGQKQKIVQIATGTALWYKSGYPIIPIRWVLIKDPDGQFDPMALLCTDLELKPLDVICFFIRRWAVEVTFEEVRSHLGVESQRQWSDKAIARTTPILMALFSIVTLWADKLHADGKMLVPTCAWYQKTHPTFSDAIACVRRQIWRNQKFLTSYFEDDVHNLSPDSLDHLISLAIRSA